MPHYGIDISSNNPHPIDYVETTAALKALGGGGQPFVIVKATQGTGYINPFFAEDVAGFTKAGAAVGAYLMDQGNADVAAEEAVFRRVAGGLPQFDDDELPMGNNNYAQHCAQLLAQNPAAVDYLNQSEEDAGFPLGIGGWEANYNHNPGQTHRPGVLIHQYSDGGVIRGIQGYVDMNAFLGTEEQFAQIFHLTVNPQEAPVTGPQLTRPIIAIVARPQADGYWIVAQDGGVFAFGNAKDVGNVANANLQPGHLIIDASATPTGEGLTLVGEDGGVFNLGDSKFHGSIPQLKVAPSNQPIS